MRLVRALGLIAGLALAVQSHAVPQPAQVRAAFPSSDAELLDRHGISIQRLRIDMRARRQEWSALADVSPALVGAVLQAEDKRFYQHGGVDLKAIGTAAWDNLFRDRPRGASTITMQLAGLLDAQLQPSAAGRSLGQKWDQAVAARALEAAWSKPQILEAYLNLVSYRGELQGVGAASQVMFGKMPAGLNQVEALILAALIRAPNAAPRIVSARACALAIDTKLAVPCSVIETAATAALLFPTPQKSAALAPQVAQKLLKSPAQRVTSTLDAALQRHATDSLRQQLAALRERNVGDAAAVVLDNDSGQILAYVANGGDSEVDGVTALRQAGSTLKPFLYQLAIERKLLTAASILDDSAIDISTPGGLYIPQNYDRHFKGYVSVRTSLGNSLNVPAVRTLVLTGMAPFHQRLRALGISSLTEAADYYGFSLALGSAEVSLLELTNAFRTLANHGMAGPVSLLPGQRAEKRRVLDARASFIVGDILSDRAARSLTFGLQSELATPYWSAVKTGTSKDMRDNWCIGYSQKYTVGVWVGNFNGEPMWDVSGISGAAPIWRELMDYLHRGVANKAPPAPGGVKAQAIEYRPALEAGRREWFIAGTENAVIELVTADQRSPKIRYPGEGMIIALDPDIPHDRQRVLFQAQGAHALEWRLDDVPLASAGADHAWSPQPGAHRLTLVDASGQAIDEVHFQVRGSLPTVRD